MEENYLYYYMRGLIEFTTPSLQLALVRSTSDIVKRISSNGDIVHYEQ